MEDINSTALTLSSDVSYALSQEVDELSTYHHDFKNGLQRAFRIILSNASLKKEKVIIFNEAIPGFTLMLFKKTKSSIKWLNNNNNNNNKENKDYEKDYNKNVKFFIDSQLKESQPDKEVSVESIAASEIIGQFFSRTKNRVLSVENNDCLFVFFPVSDLRKNLKEMGFYVTEQE